MTKTNPWSFQDVGFLTGKELTLAGIRAVSTDFGNAKMKENNSARVGLHFFYTTVNKEGKKQILSGFAHLGAWNNQLKPTKNRKGFIIPNGADRPGFEKGSELHMYLEALINLDFPKELVSDMSDWTGLLGTKLILGEKPVKNQRRAKKSVDPDDQGAPVKERTTEIPVKIVLLPSDNPKFKPLTDEQIDEHIEERKNKAKARKAADSDDDEDVEVETEDEEEAEDDDADEEEESEEESEEEESDDEDGGEEEEEEESEESDDESSDDEESEDDEEEEEAPAKKPAGKADPYAVKAANLVRQVLKGKPKGLAAADLAKAIHPLVKDEDKKTKAEVLKRVQTSSFVEKVKNVVVKNGKARLAAAE